jgi:hypothetical protein
MQTTRNILSFVHYTLGNTIFLCEYIFEKIVWEEKAKLAALLFFRRHNISKNEGQT